MIDKMWSRIFNFEKDRDIFTSDFPVMMSIILLNSVGFFFLDFAIPIIGDQVLHASGTSLGLLFSLILIGHTFSSLFVGAIVDRVNKRYLVTIGSFGRGIAYFVLYYGIQIV